MLMNCSPEAVQCTVVWSHSGGPADKLYWYTGGAVERWFHDSSLSSIIALASMSLNWCQQCTAEDMLNY